MIKFYFPAVIRMEHRDFVQIRMCYFTFHGFRLLPLYRKKRRACKAKETVDAQQMEILCERVRMLNWCALYVNNFNRA